MVQRDKNVERFYTTKPTFKSIYSYSYISGNSLFVFNIFVIFRTKIHLSITKLTQKHY